MCASPWPIRRASADSYSAVIFPSAMSLPKLIANVAELAHLLSAECFAERYALTLRLMLSNFRRKTGVMSTVPGTPRQPWAAQGGGAGTGTGTGTGGAGADPAAAFAGELDTLLSLPQMGFEGFEGLGEVDNGFEWPMEFSPSALPVWLQDNVSGPVQRRGLGGGGEGTVVIMRLTRAELYGSGSPGGRE